MGLSLSDFDPTYSKGAAGKVVGGGIDFLINPFVAIGNEVASYLGNELVKALTPDVDYSDRKLNSRGPTAPRRIIYGEARVGGQVVYIESTGTDSKELHMVIALAGHECEEIGDVYLNDTISTNSKFSGKLSVYKQPLGGANANLGAFLSSRGKTSYLYENVAYIYLVMTYDEETYTSIPSITATVKGKNTIYDPRTLTSGYTDNAALCMLDFLRTERGVGDEFINMTSWANAADIADQQVSAATGTEKRFALNGTLARNGSKLQSFTKMAVNSGIYPSRVEGIYNAVPSIYTAPAANAIIDESDILGDVQITTGNNKQDKTNTVIGTYIDSATNYEKVEYPSIQTPDFETEDREVLQQTIDYQLVSSGTQCRRLSKIVLEQSRRGITVTFNARYRTLIYTVGDRIKLNYAGLDWSEKVFRVVARKISPQNGVNLTLREDDPAIYSWEEGDALATVVPPFLDMPNPNEVAAPTAFEVEETLYRANTQAAIKSRASFSWELGDNTAKYHALQGSYEGGQYRDISSYISGTTFKFDDLQLGSWIFRVRAINSIGAASPWVSINKEIQGKLAPPPNVAGFKGIINPFAIELAWDQSPDIDVSGYEIRLGMEWTNAAPLQTLSALKWKWETRPTGNEVVLIKAIDTSGNYSLNASPATVIIQPPKSVEPLSANVVDNNVELYWSDATTSFNVETYEIRKGLVYDTAEIIGNSKGTFKSKLEVVGGSFTYWVTAIDVQGNVGTPASVLAFVDQPPDFILQANQLLDLTLGTAVNLINVVGESITFDSTDAFTWDSTTSFTFDLQPTFALLGPADITETWDEHFRKLDGFFQPVTFDSDSAFTWDSDNAFTFDESYKTVQQLQIDNGFPSYLQPTPATASYEQVVDFEGILALSRIQLIPTVTVLTGSAEVVYTLSYSEDNITYTDVTGTDATGINFRYVKVRLDISSPSGIDVIKINSLRLRLDVKLKTDAGIVEVTDTVDPTDFLFNLGFVDIQSIQMTAAGIDRLATYNFVDAPNPTGASINLQDRLTGDRVTGTVSWNVRGV
jgi:hypothetical protein